MFGRVRLIVIFLLAGYSVIAQPFPEPKLWYKQPADASLRDGPNGWQNNPAWLNALPVGNGFMGAMVFGDVDRERIQLNEKSLWSGSPANTDNPAAVVTALACLTKIALIHIFTVRKRASLIY